MSSPSTSSGLRDNQTRGSAGDFLKGATSAGRRTFLRFRLFQCPRIRRVERILGLRRQPPFPLGDPTSVTRLDPDGKHARHYVLGNEGQELTLGNQLPKSRSPAKALPGFAARWKSARSFRPAFFTASSITSEKTDSTKPFSAAWFSPLPVSA